MIDTNFERLLHYWLGGASQLSKEMPEVDSVSGGFHTWRFVDNIDTNLRFCIMCSTTNFEVCCLGLPTAVGEPRSCHKRCPRWIQCRAGSKSAIRAKQTFA